MMMKYLACLSAIVLMSCIGKERPAIVNSPPVPPTPASLQTPTDARYSWLKADYDPSQSLEARFDVPKGSQRVVAEKGSLTDWLRHLPLKPVGSEVLLFNGDPKGRQDVHAAVLDIDTGDKDLQQCADAVMRLRAEYYYSIGAYSKIHFKFTSGHVVSFDDWRQGKKPLVKGNGVTFSAKSGAADNSYANFRKYMDMVFNYAGTASLSKELKAVEVEDIQPGDVFIHGGFPGHALTVLDVAVDKSSGIKYFMVAQSYMPAQNIHLLKNLHEKGSSPWYSVDFGETLETPEWTFDRNELKRFEE